MRTKLTGKTRVGLWGQTKAEAGGPVTTQSPKRGGAGRRPDQRAAMRDDDGGRNEPDPHPNERGFRRLYWYGTVQLRKVVN